MKLLLTFVLLLSPLRAPAQAFESEAGLMSDEPTTSSPSPGNRRSAPLSVAFTETRLKEALDALGEMAGVKVLYDADLRDSKVSLALRDESFDAALRQITLIHMLFVKDLDSETIVIVPDTPQKHRRYDGWVPSGPLRVVRNRAPIQLSFTEAPLRDVFDALGRVAGVKLLYDADLRDRKLSIRFEEESFETALDELTLVNNLFYQVIDGHSVVIAPDTPAKRRQYGGIDPAPPSAPPVLGCANEPPTGPPGATGEGSGVRFADGLWVGFATRLSGPPVDAPVQAFVQPETRAPGRWAVDRVVSDRERRHYVGYRLELQAPASGPLFQVAIKPLPEASWARLCRSCPSGASGAPESKIARYPPPFELGSGGSFALDVMENVATGEKIVDQVTIVQAPRGGGRGSRIRRFKVQLSVGREAGVLAAGVCVRDLESGETLGGIPRFRITSRSSSLAFSQAGRSTDGKPLSVNLRLTLENEGRTALYTVEIWEAQELIHAEEARFPVASSFL